MATNNCWNNQVTTAIQDIVLNSVDDAIYIGATGAHLIQIGSSESTSDVTIQGGASGGIHLNSNGSTMDITSGALTIEYGNGGDFLLRSGGLPVKNAIVSSENGVLNYPSQPAFSAYNDADQTNVTGDGTAYTVQFNTALFDQASNFNTGTGVFTAPVQGIYRITCNLVLSGISTLHTSAQAYFSLTGKDAYFTNINPFAVSVSGDFAFNGSVLLPMLQNDTCSVILVVSGSTKTVNVEGGSSSLYQPGLSIELVL